MKYLESQWNEYREAVLPKDAPQVQLTETKRAFFAGAASFYVVIMNGLESGGGEPTENDMNLMKSIVAEFDEFGERVKRGES